MVDHEQYMVRESVAMELARLAERLMPNERMFLRWHSDTAYGRTEHDLDGDALGFTTQGKT